MIRKAQSNWINHYDWANDHAAVISPLSAEQYLILRIHFSARYRTQCSKYMYIFIYLFISNGMGWKQCGDMVVVPCGQDRKNYESLLATYLEHFPCFTLKSCFSSYFKMIANRDGSLNVFYSLHFFFWGKKYF